MELVMVLITKDRLTNIQHGCFYLPANPEPLHWWYWSLSVEDKEVSWSMEETAKEKIKKENWSVKPLMFVYIPYLRIFVRAFALKKSLKGTVLLWYHQILTLCWKHGRHQRQTLLMLFRSSSTPSICWWAIFQSF